MPSGLSGTGVLLIRDGIQPVGAAIAHDARKPGEIFELDELAAAHGAFRIRQVRRPNHVASGFSRTQSGRRRYFGYFACAFTSRICRMCRCECVEIIRNH